MSVWDIIKGITLTIVADSIEQVNWKQIHELPSYKKEYKSSLKTVWNCQPLTVPTGTAIAKTLIVHIGLQLNLVVT